MSIRTASNNTRVNDDAKKIFLFSLVCVCIFLKRNMDLRKV